MTPVLRWAAAAAGALLLALLPVVPSFAATVRPTDREAKPASAAPVSPTGAAALTAEDISAYVDGFMPFALARGDIAGAVVVVVKDGQILFEKGYGYADVAHRSPVDPKTTQFRPGSISKLFTWTAVMQLVESGKLDLDADINRYLDFKIPPRSGRPITLRDLMTHSSGFEEAFKGIETTRADQVPSLEAYVKAWTPTRIHPAGTIVAYSNYGASLAGYIVQRVSGERFEDYVARHILGPLGMRHSTFEQTPAATRDRSTGYLAASGPPQPFEYVGDAPAGALSASGEDMGRFMLAHLGEGTWNGAAILRPQTARLMHAPAFTIAPQLNSMALGFYGADRNGRRVIGHAGDLMTFHADLHLLPNDRVGLFVAMNSWGKANASSAVREALFAGFMDRYFPAAPPNEPTWPSAAKDGLRLVGDYEVSRRSDDTFASLAALLGQGHMAQRPDGTLTFSRFLDAHGRPKVWREVGPFVWREVGGTALVSAVVDKGVVRYLATSDQPPIAVWAPAPAGRAAAWVLPVMAVVVAVLAVTVLAWPLAAWIRWVHRKPFPLAGTRALTHRLSRLGALANLAYLASWLTLIALASAQAALLGPSLDPWLRAIQALGVLGAGLTVFVGWNAVLAGSARPWRWWSSLANAALLAACLLTLWFTAAFHLITSSLHY